MTNSRILLVEDEPAVRMIVRDLLLAEGWDVEAVGDGETGVERWAAGNHDLVILDVMLPGMDGFAVCHALREKGCDAGILMLTARTQVDDRVRGLRTGADDYVMKPFEPSELLARAAALLRRVHKEQLTPVTRYQFGDVVADFAREEVTRGGVPLGLAAKEMQLLKYLIQNRGQIVSRDRLLGQVWKQQPFISPRTVDVHIAWLRQKLEADAQNPQFILTIRGEGYRFRPGT